MNNMNVTIPWPEWKVVRRIGNGSYGAVYEIERDFYGEKEKAALKVMSIPRDRGEIEAAYTSGYDEASVRGLYKEYLKEIRNEYHLLKKLEGHSNIVNCEDYKEVEHKGEIGWDIYIRMELLDSLNKLLLKRGLTEKEVIKLGKDICQALKACEAEKIVHRDIKPGNILLSKNGDFKLGDFGVARTMDHTTQATKAGAELYMSPEVIKREPYDKDVDIYSLGLVIYTLLNRGRMPYLPIDRPATLKEADAAFGKRVRPTEKSQFRLPPPAYGSEELKGIVLKACEYRREDRYQMADYMLADLENLDLKGLSDEPLPYPVVIKPDEYTEPETSKPEDIPSSPEEESEPVEPKETPTSGNRWDSGDTIGKKPTGNHDAPGDGPTIGPGWGIPPYGEEPEQPQKPRYKSRLPKEKPNTEPLNNGDTDGIDIHIPKRLGKEGISWVLKLIDRSLFLVALLLWLVLFIQIIRGQANFESNLSGIFWDVIGYLFFSLLIGWLVRLFLAILVRMHIIKPIGMSVKQIGYNKFRCRWPKKFNRVIIAVNGKVVRCVKNGSFADVTAVVTRYGDKIPISIGSLDEDNNVIWRCEYYVNSKKEYAM